MSGNGARSLSCATVADPYTLGLSDPCVIISTLILKQYQRKHFEKYFFLHLFLKFFFLGKEH
jgi:hypothetical protein